MKLTIFCTILLFLLSGCSSIQEYRNISKTSGFEGYIGNRYTLVVDFYISGVNAPPGYGKTVDYYVVNPSIPGWAGPEVITRATIKDGIVLVVDSVHECANCLFGLTKLRKAEVKITGYTTEYDLPIHVPLQYLNSKYVQQIK